MSGLYSAILAVAVSAESSVVGVTENVTLITCAQPLIKEASMPLDRLTWRIEGGPSPTDEVSVGASFPGIIDGLKFQLLEAIVSDTGQYKFEIAPTFAMDGADEPGPPRLDFRVRTQRRTISNIKFEFIYSRPAKQCTDERRIFHLNAGEALNAEAAASRGANEPK